MIAVLTHRRAVSMAAVAALIMAMSVGAAAAATGSSYATDPACQGRASWTHLADRRWEIHDTQYLTGLLVDAHVADPARVVVTGDSYGGGQSWLLALSQDQVMLPGGQLIPWRSPNGIPIRPAAPVPQFTWTDLSQALLDTA